MGDFHKPGFRSRDGSFDTGSSVTHDNMGNILVTGRFRGIVDFDPSASTSTLQTTGSSSDAFIAKYSSSGTFVWAKNIGDAGNDYGNGIAIDQIVSSCVNIS